MIEHVGDVMKTMEEFHRLARAGGEVLIVTPHYTDFSSFCDPTHRWHLNSFSLATLVRTTPAMVLFECKIRGDFGPRKATSVVEVARIPISSEHVSAVPAILGTTISVTSCAEK